VIVGAAVLKRHPLRTPVPLTEHDPLTDPSGRAKPHAKV